MRNRASPGNLGSDGKPSLPRDLRAHSARPGSWQVACGIGVARALALGAAAVVALTIPVGVGMAVAQSMLPAFVKSRFADRFGSRRAWLVGLAAFCLLGAVGIVALPGAAWLWVVLFGAAGGGVFPLLMTLPLDGAAGPADVGSVVAMMLGLGYTLSAVAPFALGGIRDMTGGFHAALWVLVGLAVVNPLVCSTLSRERLRRGVRGAPAT